MDSQCYIGYHDLSIASPFIEVEPTLRFVINGDHHIAAQEEADGPGNEKLWRKTGKNEDVMGGMHIYIYYNVYALICINIYIYVAYLFHICIYIYL